MSTMSHGSVEDTVNNLINGLGMLRACIDSQVLAGFPSEQAHDRMFESYQARFNELPRIANTETHMKLLTAIGRTPWTAAQKQALMDILHSRSVEYSKTKKPPRSGLQACEHFENMVPDVMWEDLKNNARTNHSAAVLLAHLGSKLGLINASEKTLYRMVAIVGFVQKYQILEQDEVRRLKKVIQDSLHSLASVLPEDYPYMISYIGTHLRMRVCLFVCLCTCLCICSFVCLYLFLYLFVCLRDCLVACLLVCLFVCVLVCLFVS